MEKKLKKILKQLRLNEDTISMFLGFVVLVVVGLLVYNYFTSMNKGQISYEAPQTELTPTPGEVKLVEENGKQYPQGLPSTYKVQKGEHLWQIAEKFYSSGYNWVDIATANNLKNANRIEIGQELTIPKVEVKKVTTPIAIKPVTPDSIEGSQYTTTAGDHLWGIAIRAYGDGYAWTKIYSANQEAIGTNPNLLEKGVALTIPR